MYKQKILIEIRRDTTEIHAKIKEEAEVSTSTIYRWCRDELKGKKTGLQNLYIYTLIRSYYEAKKGSDYSVLALKEDKA